MKIAESLLTQIYYTNYSIEMRTTSARMATTIKPTTMSPPNQMRFCSLSVSLCIILNKKANTHTQNHITSREPLTQPTNVVSDCFSAHLTFNYSCDSLPEKWKYLENGNKRLAFVRMLIVYSFDSGE